VKPQRLRPGDRVHLVSPASTPTAESVAETAKFLGDLGLEVHVGRHALDSHGFLAGTDDDRAADLNAALRDPEARAVIATRGGKGAYRVADRLDFDAARAHPKVLVGFSEVTILQLALLHHGGVPSIHGAAWSPRFDPESSDSIRAALFTTADTVIQARGTEPTAALTTSGIATGVLVGGNQDMIATAAGWCLPDLSGAILLLEDVDKRLGHIDRQLTMLANAGHLDGIVGVAVGQYEGCGPDATTQGDWTVVDVLRDRLYRLGVPVLGGLPIGHGASPRAVPIGARAVLDADAGMLTIASAVR